GIAEIHSTPAHVASTGTVGRWAASKGGALLLNLQRSGRARFTQAGREVVLETGDITILNLTRPWEVDDDRESVHVSIKLPAERLASALAELEPRFLVPLRPTDMRAKLLASAMENIWQLALRGDTQAHGALLCKVLAGATEFAMSEPDRGWFAERSIDVLQPQ